MKKQNLTPVHTIYDMFEQEVQVGDYVIYTTRGHRECLAYAKIAAMNVDTQSKYSAEYQMLKLSCIVCDSACYQPSFIKYSKHKHIMDSVEYGPDHPYYPNQTAPRINYQRRITLNRGLSKNNIVTSLVKLSDEVLDRKKEDIDFKVMEL